MNKILSILLIVFLSFILSSCSSSENGQSEIFLATSNLSSYADESIHLNPQLNKPSSVQPSLSQDSVSQTQIELETEMEDSEIINLQIIIGQQTFSAKLYNNSTTKELIKQMPMTLVMNELNGNEKYYYFSNSLQTDAQRPSQINAGDIMLYGSDCLVLFYETFSTLYSYTPLGYIEDTTGLAQALGSNNIEVSFQID